MNKTSFFADDYPSNATILPMKNENAPNLRNVSDVVTKLYGSESTAKSSFWDKVNCNENLHQSMCGLVEIYVLEELKIVADNGL